MKNPSGHLFEDVLVFGALGLGGYLLWNYLATLPAAATTTTTATTTPVATVAATPVTAVATVPATTPTPSGWGGGYMRAGQGYQGGQSGQQGGGVQRRGPSQRIGNAVATPCTFTAADGTTQSGMLIQGTCQNSMTAG
jgi:hypothetical protein